MRSAINLLLLSLALVVHAASAEPLAIPGHSQASVYQVMPARGINMNAVLSEFGQPDEQYGPIGDPAITEWVYGSFRVYFENETVLHVIDLNTLIYPQSSPTP